MLEFLEMLIALSPDYFIIITDKIDISLTMLLIKVFNLPYFDGKDEIYEKLNSQIELYRKGIKEEKNLLDYILKNQKRLYYDDIADTLEELAPIQKKRIDHIEYILEKASFALSERSKNHFRYYGREDWYLTVEGLEELKKKVQGFSDENLIRFLLEEKVYNDIDLSGVRRSILSEKSISLPDIYNEESMMKNIGELLKYFIEQRKLEEINLSITNDIPIFYKQLYSERNDFITQKIEGTKLSNILFDEYKGEPFEEQLEKYKYYVKRM